MSLAEARERAQETRRLVAAGVWTRSNSARVRTAVGATWGDCFDALIANLQPSWKTLKQVDVCTQSLNDYGPDRDLLPVASVDTPLTLALLRPQWTARTETASRERVWDYAKVSGLVTGDNPFRWRGRAT